MDKQTLTTRLAEKLIFFGVLLFFLGLIVGLFIPMMANPRMGLSSHLEGILNGIFLIVLGLIWHRITLSARWQKITYALAIYGTFANWAGILVAALLDAGAPLTVAAQGNQGTPLAEAIVGFALITLTIAMLTISITVLVGLRRSMKQASIRQASLVSS